MGNRESPIYNIHGEEIKNKKCIIMVTPPSFEIGKLVGRLPVELEYEYISIGQMIRDEINKKTNYSRIIMDNLQKDRKINENILDILLRNATLIGNFVIRYAPIDQDQVAIWKKFLSKANVQLTVIVRSEVDENIMKRRCKAKEKMEEYERDVKDIRAMVSKNSLVEVGSSEAVEVITKRLRETTK